MARGSWITGIQLLITINCCCNALEGWLVAGNFQVNIMRNPPCEALCFSILGDHGAGNVQPGDVVGLYGCGDIKFLSATQRWRYENNTLSIPATSAQDRLCLSAALGDIPVFMEQCNHSRSSQYWEVDDANKTIRNGDLLYLKTLGGFLSSLGVSRKAESAFTLLVSEGNGSSIGTSMDNGNFSRFASWLYDPSYGQFPRVRGTFRYSVCNWTLDNTRDLAHRALAVPGCPSTALDLNGSGSVSQRISVGKGKQYILSFQHGGLNNSCAATGMAVVSAGAANLLSTDFMSSSDGICKRESIPFNSTADGDVVITLRGAGDCGPVIGNVMFGIGEAARSALTSSPASSPTPAPMQIILPVACAALVAGAVAAMAAHWIWRRCSFKGLKVSEVGPSLQRFSVQEIETMTDNFRHLLGSGGFGSVYLATTSTGIQYAVKSFKSEGADFKLELSMLGRVHHRCILACHGYCLDRGQVYLVLEYMTNGSVSDHLHKAGHGTLDWEKRVRIAKDVALGLLYLHHGADPPILHRDVKPANVLLHEDFKAKLADFGISKAARIAADGNRVATTNSSIRGTLVYMDPQVFQAAQAVSGKTDVYSYGIMLLELITGVKPAFGEDMVERAKGAAFFQDVVDPRLGNAYDLHDCKSLLDTALLCVAEYEHRPIMSKVWDLIKDLGLAQETEVQIIP